MLCMTYTLINVNHLLATTNINNYSYLVQKTHKCKTTLYTDISSSPICKEASLILNSKWSNIYVKTLS